MEACDERRRHPGADRSGEDPDQGEFAENRPEDRGPRPAEREERPKLSPPDAYGGECAVEEEDGTDDEDEGEQREVLAVERAKVGDGGAFLTQPSLSVSAGRPNFPAGSLMVIGVGEEPAVMSTSSPVRSWMSCATVRIRASLKLFGPVTPSTGPG